MRKCCQCQRRIKVGSMCNECCKRNQQGDGWRLRARHCNFRGGKLAIYSFFPAQRRLKLAIKAAKIRMPWQTVRAVKGWITDTGFNAYWSESDDGLTPQERREIVWGGAMKIMKEIAGEVFATTQQGTQNNV